MSQKLIRDYVFTPGATGVGTIKIPGRYSVEQLVEIVNATTNTVLYDSKTSRYSGTKVVYTAGNDTSFPTISQREDGFTTITLRVNTNSSSSTDKLRISVEQGAEAPMVIRPYAFGTDAIERMRVSNPQSMIDADFEYGLQPTKWAGYGTVRGYPSTYELPAVDLTVNAITTDYNTTSTYASLITVTTSTSHSITAGQVVNITGLAPGITGFSRADGTFVVYDAPSGSTLRYFARGIVGTASAQSLFTDTTVIKRGDFYSGASLPSVTATSNGATPSVITLTFTNPHGLIPGSPLHINATGGTGFADATGPFVVTSTPSITSITFLARGVITTANLVGMSFTVYALSNATFMHRPTDGGVILATKTPSYGASVIRQSKKYFRYQSGKGFIWSTGTLFKPNYDIATVTADSTAVGATITVTTDDWEHGLQIGATIELAGVVTSGYNGIYTVASITSDYQFTVTATSILGATTAILGISPHVYVKAWHGASVRAGMFDDQNGLFWEFDGNNLYVVKRNATTQLSGTVSATANSNAVTGTGTRFTQQLRSGDRIVMRGMTHHVINVVSDTSINISPDYRGTTTSGLKANLIQEFRVKQSDFNIDTINGNGASGYNIDLNKMQMVGLQYTWYGAGFVDFMVRGSDGNWVFAHRMKNNNVNDEAYMRSGNLPVRYSIENDDPNTSLSSAMDTSQTTIPVTDLTFFPSAGTVYIDNEMITYTGKSASSGAGNLIGAGRAASLTQWQQGTSQTFTAGVAATHTSGTGVILISNLCSPTLSHWGSALIMDGGFTTDRGYIFNYQATNLSLTTTTITPFVIRLAPSVSNSQVGALGAKELLNRSQLLLQEISAGLTTGTTPGAVIVEGVLNPKNFTGATYASLSTSANGGQPSLAQIGTSPTFSSGSFAVPGEQVFAFHAPSVTSGTSIDRLNLDALKELTGAPLGGDGKYPDGSDIMAVNIRLTAGTGTGHIILRWSEAQA